MKGGSREYAVQHLVRIHPRQTLHFWTGYPARLMEAAALNTDKNVEDRLEDLLKAQGVSKRSFTKTLGTNAIELHKTLSEVQKTVYAIAHALGTPADALFSNTALVAAISAAA